MTKYLCLYRGPATPISEFTPEQQAEQGKAWGEWIERVGSSLSEAGAPFGERLAIGDDGSNPAPSEQNGYSIVEADDLKAARSLMDAHPFLSEGKGRFSIEIFELVPMAM